MQFYTLLCVGINYTPERPPPRHAIDTLALPQTGREGYAPDSWLKTVNYVIFSYSVVCSSLKPDLRGKRREEQNQYNEPRRTLGKLYLLWLHGFVVSIWNAFDLDDTNRGLVVSLQNYILHPQKKKTILIESNQKEGREQESSKANLKLEHFLPIFIRGRNELANIICSTLWVLVLQIAICARI